jgi:hypothetical protein
MESPKRRVSAVNTMMTLPVRANQLLDGTELLARLEVSFKDLDRLLQGSYIICTQAGA